MSQTNYIQTVRTDIEAMMHEFRRQQPDRFIGNNMSTDAKVEFSVKSGVMYFYGATINNARNRRNDFIDYCLQKGIDALSCTMIEEGE